MKPRASLPAVRALLALTLALCLTVSAIAPAIAQTADQAGGPQSDVASYDISVTLDEGSKQLHGVERIDYRNPSGDTLDEVWMHLYLNAFRSPTTQWMTESRGAHRGYGADAPGWIEVESLSLAGSGKQLTLTPGDPDETIARVALPRSLGPGEALSLDVRWTAQLPRVFARTGYFEDFIMAGQFYPKLAVYDRGHWDSEPWHANSEFFADFGTYRVAITVPDGYVTGASGVREDQTANDDGSVTVKYRSERVTDVAWTAWPQFLVFQREIQAAGQQTQLDVLLPPEEAGNAERHIAAAAAALDNYGTWYGAYPWPKLTVVVPPAGAGGAGGMEYPTLVTTGTNGAGGGEESGLDRGFHNLDVVTVHEIGHQWFPMQVQTNEGREAWLDEGFADYLTTRVLARLYGPDRSYADFPGVQIGYAELMRGQMAQPGTAREPLATPSWQFESLTGYASTVYGKGSMALLSLQGLLGDDRFTKALHDYADRWRWRHPTSADLQAALEASTGRPLDWFFQSFVFGTQIVDYRVASVEPARAAVERIGEAPFPVNVRLFFANGTSLTQGWDGQGERLELDGGGKTVTGVALDPDEWIALELNRFDNTVQRSPPLSPALTLADRWLTFAQLLLQLLGQVG